MLGLAVEAAGIEQCCSLEVTIGPGAAAGGRPLRRGPSRRGDSEGPMRGVGGEDGPAWAGGSRWTQSPSWIQPPPPHHTGWIRRSGRCVDKVVASASDDVAVGWSSIGGGRVVPVPEEKGVCRAVPVPVEKGGGRVWGGGAPLQSASW